jgi:hypothetical protein
MDRANAYRVVEFRLDRAGDKVEDAEAELNRLGMQGYRVISTSTISGNADHSGRRIYWTLERGENLGRGPGDGRL